MTAAKKIYDAKLKTKTQSRNESPRPNSEAKGRVIEHRKDFVGSNKTVKGKRGNRRSIEGEQRTRGLPD